MHMVVRGQSQPTSLSKQRALVGARFLRLDIIETDIPKRSPYFASAKSLIVALLPLSIRQLPIHVVAENPMSLRHLNPPMP